MVAGDGVDAVGDGVDSGGAAGGGAPRDWVLLRGGAHVRLSFLGTYAPRPPALLATRANAARAGGADIGGHRGARAGHRHREHRRFVRHRDR